MNRREFFKKSAQYAAIGAAGMSVPGMIRAVCSAEEPPQIVVATGGPGPATRAAIHAFGGIGRFVKQGDKVVIKPNMSFSNPPDMATTTHPDVVRELARMCVEAGASSVLVLDNPLRSAELCLVASGVRQACEGLPRTQVRCLVNQGFYETVKIPDGRSLTSTMVMKDVLKADVLIAAPVAKSHSATGVSLAMKGMMGLVYDRGAFHRSRDLDGAIVDLCSVLKPALTVIDASRILSEGGPGGPGKVIPMNKVVVSRDIVAADSMAVELGTWYGRKFKARQVTHIEMAHQRGLGRLDLPSQRVLEVKA